MKNKLVLSIFFSLYFSFSQKQCFSFSRANNIIDNQFKSINQSKGEEPNSSKDGCEKCIAGEYKSSSMDTCATCEAGSVSTTTGK